MFKGPMDEKKTRLMGYTVCFLYLLIHICLLITFHLCHVRPMFYVNIGSIAFYLFMLVIVKQQRFRFYATAVYLEVVIHMVLAVAFTGWNNGFQITLVGIEVLIFYSEYLGRHLKIRYVPALPLSIIGMAGYIGSYLISKRFPAPYTISDQFSFLLQIAWAIITFSIVILFLQIFLAITLGAEKRLEHAVRHDKLTGLPNRYYMADYMEKLTQEQDLSDYWVAMIDIDDFKQINDTYGHYCGDYVLITLAKLITESTIDMTACRWGGEEFLLIGPIHGYMDRRIDELEKLRETVQNTDFCYEDLHLAVTITIGTVACSSDKKIHQSITQADAKLYEGKHNGKNQVCC